MAPWGEPEAACGGLQRQSERDLDALSWALEFSYVPGAQGLSMIITCGCG